MILNPHVNRRFVREALGRAMYTVDSLSGQPLFVDLVRRRWEELWETPHSQFHTAAECKDTLVLAHEGDRPWKCCPLWHRKLSNKLNARAFAARCGARVPKLLWFGRDPEAMPLDALPDSYVIKTSTGWSSKQVLPFSCGTDMFRNRPVSRTGIRDRFHGIMAQPGFESAWILIEEYLHSKSGERVPTDYKCYSFHGQVHSIHVIDRVAGRHVWYSRDWEAMPDQLMFIKWNRGLIEPAPESLSEFIFWGDRLAKAYHYPFVRVDLYDALDGVTFGEFTHTPHIGSLWGYTSYANRVFGALWANPPTAARLPD